MSVSAKETAAPAVPLAGQQRAALLESLSRVLPSGLARRVLAAGDADRQRIERDLHDGVQQRLTGCGFGSRSLLRAFKSAATQTPARH
jgi:signal transduction histidine kinase